MKTVTARKELIIHFLYYEEHVATCIRLLVSYDTSAVDVEALGLELV